MKKVAVVVRERNQYYEALRTSLGALLESHDISLFVLGEEIDMVEEYRDNLDIFGEMDGRYYSDNPVNVERHGFTAVDTDGVAGMLREVDVIIPFC